jgi:hypothetical protein
MKKYPSLSNIKLKKGGLPGYKLSDKTNIRRKALVIAVFNDGYVTVMRRVNIISIFLRNKSPILSKNAERDKKWLMKIYK